jgi:plasmid stability protein
MSSVHIRDIPPRTLSSLKRLARSHHRSLQGELHAILERAARIAPPEAAERSLDIVTVKVGGEHSWTRDEIYGSGGR